MKGMPVIVNSWMPDEVWLVQSRRQASIHVQSAKALEEELIEQKRKYRIFNLDLVTIDEARKLLGLRPYATEQLYSKHRADTLWQPFNMGAV